ncbi:MAG: DUF1553 domain-containing protein [Fimbriimonadales bacterium]
MRAIHGLVLASLGFASVQLITPAPTVPKVDFNRDIRQILSKCLNCHGPTNGEGSGGLRLDLPKSATAKLASGNTAIVPGKPDESALIRRVESTDDALVMPPKFTHKTTTPEERALLRQWISEGAEFKEHWAFVKPVRYAPPAVKDAAWPRNTIDRFILAKLEAAGLKPSPEASKETLIRRLSLDITGLPPTPEEVDAFLADKSKDAYEKLVDRLLASTRYGERMAMDWMDAARYADSNGYQADYERFQWRWRDWVINAFNKNMPYDQFTIEQIAGDMLPNATLDQKLATGFNRNHRINTEGGVIAEEWRVETVIDRVETTSEVWLGLTSGCARCHDHKYDPISTRDFYKMFAYFNNVPESGTGEERPVNHPPTMLAPYPQQQQDLQSLEVQISALQKGLQQTIATSVASASRWKLPNEPYASELLKSLEAAYRLSKTPMRTHGAGDKPSAVGNVLEDPGVSTGAIATNEGSFINLGNVGDVDSRDAFSFGAWINSPEAAGAAIAKMDVNNNFRGWDLFFDGFRPMVHLIDNWPENAIKIISRETIPKDKWTHVFVTYNGSAKSDGLKLYINGKSVPFDVERDNLKGSLKTNAPATIGRRTTGNFFKGKFDDFNFFRSALTPEQISAVMSANAAARIQAIPESKRTKEQSLELSRLFLLETNQPFRQQMEQVQSLTEKKNTLLNSISSVMIMQEMEKPRDCFVLVRGQYDKHGEKVTAGLPAFLPALPKNAPNNRLGFARWIVAPDNPLTPRVTVNRLWERFFGTGIVGTSEDFGTRAEFPTHPELLDWLATEIVRVKWDLKAMIKQIVMSATYRQSSAHNAESARLDPQNRMLSRGPRFRLPAELIRDQALYVSGLLVEKIGGPSVRPYQPEGIWDETNVYGNLRNYKHDEDDGLYRRSLYTIWKRTAAPPQMTTFDVPGRETCRVKRARTNTPLQALTLLNDVTFLEASRVLATNAIRSSSSMQQRIGFIFRKVLGRKPSEQEAQLLESSLAKRIAYYKANPEMAKELLTVGDAKRPYDLDASEAASYMILANTILNLDETVTKE